MRRNFKLRMMEKGDDGPKSSEEVLDWFEKQRLQGSVDKRDYGNNKPGLNCKHLAISGANTQIGKCCCGGNKMREVLTPFLKKSTQVDAFPKCLCANAHNMRNTQRKLRSSCI